MKYVRVIPFLVLLLAWWLTTDVLKLVAPLILPAPSGVLEFAREALAKGVLTAAIGGSLGRFFMGFGSGAVLGFSLAIWVGTSPRASAFFTPLAKFFQAVAGVIWIPLAVLWFGISWTAAAFIIFNTTFFVVFYNTLTGVRSINPNLTASIQTLGGGMGAILWEVLLPGSLPHLMTGLRVAVGYGWRALIAAEIITSGTGLGVLIWEGQRNLNTSGIFTGLLLIGAISFTMDRLLLRRLEAATIERWGLVQRTP